MPRPPRDRGGARAEDGDPVMLRGTARAGVDALPRAR
jgi:hypothetical protein